MLKQVQFKKLTVLLLFSTLLVLAACGGPPEDENGTETVSAFIGDVSSAATASGQIDSLAKAELAVTLQGLVTNVNVRVGDDVQTGDVLIEFDHKNLNLDTPYFTNRIPTTENLAWTLWELLAKHPQLPSLERILLYEDATLFAEVTKAFVESSSSMNTALIGRRYRFAALHQSTEGTLHGRQYELWVSAKGPIPPDTGQIINLGELDKIVNQTILQRWEQKNISQDILFSNAQVTDASLAKQCWTLLQPHLPGSTLAHISLSQQPDTAARFSGHSNPSR